VLWLATSRALHETGRISRASELLASRSAQDLGAARLPALDRLSAGSQLGMIVGLIPPGTSAAGDAADREHSL
jgi:hypothetical protein